MKIQEYLNLISKGLTINETYVELMSENISGLYVAKNDTSSDFDEENEDNECGFNEEDLSPISEVIQKTNRMVLLGDPGSGKTTVVQYLFCQYVHEFKEDGSSVLPVLLRLKDLHSLEDWSSFITSLTIDTEMLSLFNSGRVFLFLDGLNEIASDAYNDVLSAIESFIERFEDISVLVTSRKFGYKSRLNLEEYQIHDFDENAIKQYIIKRTNNSSLYGIIKDRKVINSDRISPLILKMIVDVWEAKGDLPRFRSELYASYIDYQLHKSLPGYESGYKGLVSLLAQLAFKMRNNGYISDNEDEIKNIIRGHVKDEEVDFISSLMMKSGLLSIDVITEKLHFVSFIHETFQEYLSSLYIANYYKETGSFCVSVESHMWKETVRNAIEILSHNEDATYIVRVLDTLNQSYASAGYNNYINVYLNHFVQVCKDIAYQNDICYSWLFQYLLLQMENYVRMPENERTSDLFEIVASAVLSFGNASLCRVLFFDTRWQREWLYTDEELEAEACVGIRDKQTILEEILPEAENHVIVYEFVHDLQRDLSFLQQLVNRLNNLEHESWKCLTYNDHKTLFEKNGDVIDLYCSFDPEYIWQYIHELDDESLLKSDILVSPKNMSSSLFYLKEICPILKGKNLPMFRISIIGKVLFDNDVQRLLFTSPTFADSLDGVKELCYYIPDKYLCKEYFQYLEKNRPPLFTDYQLTGNTTKLVASTQVSDDTKLYVTANAKILTDESFVKSVCGLIPSIQPDDIIWFKKYKIRRDFIAPPSDDVNLQFEIESYFSPGRVVCYYKESIYYIVIVSFASADDVPKVAAHRGDNLRWGSEVIRIKSMSSWKLRLGILSHKDLSGVEISVTPKKPKYLHCLNTDACYFYRRDELLKLDKDELEQMSDELLIQLGLIEQLPDRFIKCVNSLSFGVVKYFTNSHIGFARYKSSNQTPLVFGGPWRIGDIGYRITNRPLRYTVYYKVNNPELFTKGILLHGTVIYADRHGTTIKDHLSEQTFTCPVSNWPVGTEVTFFPVTGVKSDGTKRCQAFRVRSLTE